MNRLVQAIRLGRIRMDKPKEREEERIWDIWDAANEKPDEISRKLPPALQAPKVALPGNAESYNPPEEYLFDDEELKAWEDTDPEDR